MSSIDKMAIKGIRSFDSKRLLTQTDQLRQPERDDSILLASHLNRWSQRNRQDVDHRMSEVCDYREIPTKYQRWCLHP